MIEFVTPLAGGGQNYTFMKGPTKKKRKNAGTDGSVDSSRSFFPIFTVGRTVGLHCLFTALNNVNGGKFFRFAQTVRFFPNHNNG